MRKTIISTAAFLVAAASAFAADYVHSVVVNKTDGTKVEYKFSDKPIATIEGDNMRMSCETGTPPVLYPFAEIENLTFLKMSGVEAVGADGNVSFTLTRNAIEATGLPASARVSVYDASGALRAWGEAGPDGAVTVSTDGLDAGVYLVNAGGNSFKFIR